jgi:hypothetical protein
MQAFAAIFLLIGIFLILYNLVINLTNLSKIVGFCFDTGSLDEYWNLFYEACVSRRAIYSTIAIGIIGFLVFIAIAPFVIIKGVVSDKKITANINSGAYFKYENYNLVNKNFSYTNIDQLGIESFDMTVTGHLNIDLPFLMTYIQERCDAKKLKIEQNLMQYYDLENKMHIQVPLIIETGEKVYPLYLIYNQQHKDAFQKISPLLKENHFENALYFSILPV